MEFESIYKIAKELEAKHKIDKFLIMGIVYTESSGNHKADSGYARGLMQMSEIAVKEVNKLYGMTFTYDDMFIPYKNMEAAALYIKYLTHYWKNQIGENFLQSLVTLSYAWGITATINWLKSTKPDNGFIDEAIPEDKRYYNESVMFWYFNSKSKVIVEGGIV